MNLNFKSSALILSAALVGCASVNQPLQIQWGSIDADGIKTQQQSNQFEKAIEDARDVLTQRFAYIKNWNNGADKNPLNYCNEYQNNIMSGYPASAPDRNLVEQRVINDCVAAGNSVGLKWDAFETRKAIFEQQAQIQQADNQRAAQMTKYNVWKMQHPCEWYRRALFQYNTLIHSVPLTVQTAGVYATQTSVRLAAQELSDASNACSSNK